ncbi:MAG: hypothetical protein M0R32_09020 [Candidatus Cloacimonetes bacterium]|jgi:hypothetical protein|nr:hypothetical protein [Candidatus Cloacimonadota bacterium]
MGCLTTITLNNDALHCFKEHPEEFAKALFEGINQAEREQKEVDVGFYGYCNYITVQPTRHADIHTLYYHAGGMVQAIGQYEKSFSQWAKRDPKAVLAYLKGAEWILKDAKKFVKELPNTKEKS